MTAKPWFKSYLFECVFISGNASAITLSNQCYIPLPGIRFAIEVGYINQVDISAALLFLPVKISIPAFIHITGIKNQLPPAVKQFAIERGYIQAVYLEEII